ncbi:MAG TPA: GH92 family glycosyl hydrolase [Bacteroidales bacterium]|nr:GH92 family glycosyl hydrolase [Bacteroidales bacterium]HRZ50136.1 GH92 family glycosyl hydrolase [Bacteroidales bacterium]
MRNLSIYSCALALLLCQSSVAQFTPDVKDYAALVNPFIGTGTVDSLSLSGSNFPGACFPFGMVQLSPDTREYPDDPCSGYDYNDPTILGFSHTHLSGTGCPDLYDFLFMPYGGDIQWNAGSDDGKIPGFRSAYQHKNEKASPGYYSVVLDDYNITAELTATEHCGMHRYTFSDPGSHHFMIDLEHSLVKTSPYRYVKIINAQVRIVNDSTIEGYRIISGWAKLRKVYFRAEFSRPFSSSQVKAGKNIYTNTDVANHPDLKLILNFDTNNHLPLLVKVGLSSVSAEGAVYNLRAEVSDFNFERVHTEARAAWNRELSCIDIEGSEIQKRIFYTGLYHLFIQPNNIADVDGTYLTTDFSEKIASDGKHYSTFSLWDTYRAAHPLYTIVQQKRTAAFINSILRQYDTYGYLPIWQLWGYETYTMIGNHAIPVIVDAFFKGIGGVDYPKAYEAIRATALTSHRNAPVGLLDTFGYFPENLQSQSVSITLEIAFNDWCVAAMAKKLGHDADYKYFSQRAKAFTNLFDPATGFFRAKNSDGKWVDPFNPLAYGGNGGYPFTEGNAWQYLWYVPQDVPSFMALFGGEQPFRQKLDTFFTLEARPADVNGNASGFIGQYAHGNEPSHHIAYLYDFTAEPWKTQQYCARIMKELYNDSPSGYSGNEDCGQMSAWYIFSAMGFYPVNPANGVYCFGSPQVAGAVIHLENGRQFRIATHNGGDDRIYIQKIMLNGKEYLKNYFTHQDIMSGGTLEFTMGPKPNRKMAAFEKPVTLKF